MSSLTYFFSQPWAERLAWTLVHFLWQGAAIAALFGVARWMAAGRPRKRYALACVALGAMAAAPLMTWFWMGGPASPSGAKPPVNTGVVPVLSLSGTAVSAPVQILLPWIVMIWLAGVIAFSMRLTGAWLSTASLRSAAVRPAPAEWKQTLDRLARRMNVGARVRLLVSSRVDVPAVLGWLRPVVLVPLGVLSGLPAEQVEALLVHELAHIRRNDYIINLMQGVVEALLFYHPAMWWVSRQIRLERELCCDDLAVEASGDVLIYARALAELESCRPSRVRAAMAADGPPLAGRIRRLIEPSQPAHTIAGPGAAWLLSALLLTGFGAVAIGSAKVPQNRPSASKLSAAKGEVPTVDRKAIWVDTVRRGDMQRAVRALGALTSATTAELKIPEIQSREVKQGQLVSILFRGASDAITGRMVRLRPDARQGVVSGEVRIDGSLPPGVRTGDEVDGTIQLEVIPNAILVGRPVNVQPNTEDTLFRLEPNGAAAARVKVRFGKAALDTLQILGGLLPGDKVILSDTTNFKDFDRVNLK